MKKQFAHDFDLLAKVEPKVLREMYRHLIGDSSASTNLNQTEVDERIHRIVTLQDPEIIDDLRHCNEGRKKKSKVFWENCKKFIENKVETAVDDCRHDQVTHLACAMSVRDLVEQVTALCPPDTPIPSVQWVRLQFWPKNPTAAAQLQHTGKLRVKHMVQTRQTRMWHENAHYASALFRYLKEMAVKNRDICELVFMDDKHKCKVGEPNAPLAAVERGKSVINGTDGKRFSALDHDFSKCTLTPSVTMFCHDIEKSFYHGDVYVGLKDSAFKPSSANRHGAELSNLLSGRTKKMPMLLLYTDRGGDHNVQNVSTQISLINTFLENDLDFLQAVRTPRYHSWKNPVERVNCILNLGLQSIGLMRAEMDKQNERLMKACSSMKDVLSQAEGNQSFKGDYLDSMAPVKALLSTVFQMLKLKDVPFSVYNAATDSDLEKHFSNIASVDKTITAKDLSSKVLQGKPSLCSALLPYQALLFWCEKMWRCFLPNMQASTNAHGNIQRYSLPPSSSGKWRPLPAFYFSMGYQRQRRISLLYVPKRQEVMDYLSARITRQQGMCQKLLCVLSA